MSDFEEKLIYWIEFLIGLFLIVLGFQVLINFMILSVSAADVGTYRNNPLNGICSNYDYYVMWSVSRQQQYQTVTDSYALTWNMEDKIEIDGNQLSGDMLLYSWISGSDVLIVETVSSYEVNNAQKFNIYSNVAVLGYPANTSITRQTIKSIEAGYNIWAFIAALFVGCFATELCLFGKRL